MAQQTKKISGATELSDNPGAIMPDGTVYGGVSPDTGRAFYAAAQDAPELLNWRRANNYASQSKAHGRDDWRLPTFGELGVMFNNRAAIGNFNETGLLPAGWYWSSSESDYNNRYARGQRFSDGGQANGGKDGGLAVRCVRG